MARLEMKGSNIWMKGDSDPFCVTELPDVASQKVADGVNSGAKFVILTARHSPADGEDEDVFTERSMYVDPTEVRAVSARLYDTEDD